VKPFFRNVSPVVRSFQKVLFSPNLSVANVSYCFRIGFHFFFFVFVWKLLPTRKGVPLASFHASAPRNTSHLSLCPRRVISPRIAVQTLAPPDPTALDGPSFLLRPSCTPPGDRRCCLFFPNACANLHVSSHGVCSLQCVPFPYFDRVSPKNFPSLPPA